MALLTLIAYLPDVFAASVDTSVPSSIQPNAVYPDSSPAQELMAQTDANGFLCATPAPAIVETCLALEHQILASVVRLEVRSPAVASDGRWAGGKGHGTIMDGRYVVIHNHFSVPLSSLKNAENNGGTAVSLFKANGEKILLEAPPTVFTVVVEDPGTLVLDFGTNEAGQGFFEALGLPSARFKTWQNFQLEPGVEVAQVDWDGTQAHVDWVQVSDILVEDGTPTLELDNALTLGASGGGVFWQGFHIANNWSTVSVHNESGAVVREYSNAALNSPLAIAPVKAAVS